MATLGDIVRHGFGNIIWAQLATTYPQPTAPLSLEGRTYIVTGANGGLGLALAIHLARLGASRIVLAVRDLSKGETAREEIVRQTGCSSEVLSVWELDMARFASVAAFADRVNTQLDRLDGAALNAGVATNFQVNALSTGLLAVLLLKALQRTARLEHLPGVDHIPPHLTITGSGGQNIAKFPERNEPNILTALNDEVKYNANMSDRYPTSKLFNYFIAQKVSGLEEAEGVVVNVVDPGMNHSDLPRESDIPFIGRVLIKILAWPASKGALNILHGLLGPDTKKLTTGVYISRTRSHATARWLSTPQADEVVERVWKEMMDVWERAVGRDALGVVVVAASD
ncbi:hypothetical protein C8F01DRAFT_1219182 [Mycena amicta]|nr:hypothetical protein C8F01DRAFT_1219182 [Mycena amicta]